MSKPMRYRRNDNRDEQHRRQTGSDVRQLTSAGGKLIQEGKSAEAIPLLEQANAIDPDDFDATLNLSAAYITGGRFKKAIPILENLRARYPELPQIWINLGAAYLGNPILATDEQQLRAIAAFERALALNPIAFSVAYNIGLIYRDRRDNEQAIYWFRQAISHNPNDEHARNQLRLLLDKEQGE